MVGVNCVCAFEWVCGSLSLHLRGRPGQKRKETGAASCCPGAGSQMPGDQTGALSLRAGLPGGCAGYRAHAAQRFDARGGQSASLRPKPLQVFLRSPWFAKNFAFLAALDQAGARLGLSNGLLAAGSENRPPPSRKAWHSAGASSRSSGRVPLRC